MLLHSDLPAATVQLRVRVHSFPIAHIERIDTFTKGVVLSADDRRFVDVPVLLRYSDKASLEVQETNAGGNILSEDAQALEPPLGETLVAVLCVQPSVCQKAQSQISFSGNASEQTGKGKALKFVTIEEPPEQSWQYLPAKTVVFARPVEELTPAQRDALEDFARQGAALIVIEDEARSPTFLAAYRAARSPGAPTTIGRGKILWISESGWARSGRSVCRAEFSAGRSRLARRHLWKGRTHLGEEASCRSLSISPAHLAACLARSLYPGYRRRQFHGVAEAGSPGVGLDHSAGHFAGLCLRDVSVERPDPPERASRRRHSSVVDG